MKKIFLVLIIAGAIGVLGSGVLENIITVDSQELSKFQGVNSLSACVCEDPQTPGTYSPCNQDNGLSMCEP